MFDCYKKVEDLKRDGFVFSQKLTDIGFNILNKFQTDREKAYHETIKFIRDSNLSRATDDIEIGYDEIKDNDDKVVGHSFGIFIKGNDSPRKVLFDKNKRELNKNENAPHIVRLLHERDELQDRLEKLTMFINTNITFRNLPDVERDLMISQFSHMLQLLNVLNARLALVNINPKEPKIKLELN